MPLLPPPPSSMGMDARLNPEAPVSPEHVATLRSDYRPPDWLVPHVRLRFELDARKTRVQASMDVERNPAVSGHLPLHLSGDGLVAVGVWVDGQPTDDWSMDGGDLIIPLAGNAHEIGIESEIDPSANSQLMGLYASGGILCTQCESEGFRRITFHPRRTDVLRSMRCALQADKARFPILLAKEIGRQR